MPRRLALWGTLGAAAIAAAAALHLSGALTPKVTLVAATRGPAVQAIYATGIVEPVEWARVGPLQSGRIVEIMARDGQAVAKGQPLIRFDDREASARLAELEAKLRYWREEVARQETLQQRGVASREAFERAQAEFAALIAAIAGQKQRLSELTLLSPVDGIVLRQDGEIGEVVDARQTVMWVGRPLPLRITAEVDEEDIPLVRAGQKALVKADAFPGEAQGAEVAEITPRGDPVNKSFRVRLALPDDTPLRIGMTVETNIVVRETRDALLLPAGAVADGKVFVVEDGRVRARAVRLGVRGRTHVEVLGGLAEGERAVADPAGLADGERVRLPAR